MNIKQAFNQLKKRKKLGNDFFYTFLASAVGGVILQIVVFPIITKYYGVSYVGNILFYMGIIYIVPQSVGASIGNTRLILRKTHELTNGDYWPALMLYIGFSAVICAAIGLGGTKSIPFSIAYGLFSILQAMKLYARTDFRLVLNFKGYFIYHLVAAVGYLIGLVVFFLTEKWLWIFVIGETLSILYVIRAGNIFKNVKSTGNVKNVNKAILPLLWTFLVRDGVIHFDKVIINQILNAYTVTQYHVVSVIAKTLLLFVNPITALMITYMTQKEWQLTRKIYKRILLSCMGMLLIAYAFSVVGTPIFIKLFYSTLYDDVIQYNLIVNLGLIIGFISSILTNVLASHGELKIISIIQTIWGFSYIIIAFLAVSTYGLWGLAFSTLAVNAVKLIITIVASNRLLPQYFKQ